MVLGSIILGLKYLLTRPYTRLVPEKEPPFKTETTRGRHVLFMEKCTGCTMCQRVCPADAIQMVRVEGEWKMNRKKIFPRIDMQRCTFCAMCVEICPTGALAMTDMTGWEMVTDNKETTIYMPYQMTQPEGHKLTVSKQKWIPPPPMFRPKPKTPPKKATR